MLERKQFCYFITFLIIFDRNNKEYSHSQFEDVCLLPSTSIQNNSAEYLFFIQCVLSCISLACSHNSLTECFHTQVECLL